MIDHKELMKQGSDLIAANLAECCREELEWQNTALLCNGKMREAGAIYSQVDAAHALSIVQSEVARQAMQVVAAAPQVVADERAAFEVHITDNGTWPRAAERSVDGEYRLMATAVAWNTWRAATDSFASRAAAPVQAQEPVAGKPCPYCGSTDGAHDKAYPHPRAPVQPVAVPDGWKLVPREATRAMIDAASAVEEDGFDAMHKAMLASAPAALAAQGDAKELTKEDMHEAYYAYSGNSEIDYDGREWSNFMGGWDAAIAAKAAS